MCWSILWKKLFFLRILWSSYLKWNRKRTISSMHWRTIFSLSVSVFLFLLSLSTLTWLQISMHLITIWNGINQNQRILWYIYFSTSKDSCTCHQRVISVDVMNAFSIRCARIRPLSFYKLWISDIHCIN